MPARLAHVSQTPNPSDLAARGRVLPQPLHVCDQMVGRVAGEVRLRCTGVGYAAPAVTLIEEQETVGTGIEDLAVPRGIARAGAALHELLQEAASMPCTELAANFTLRAWQSPTAWSARQGRGTPHTACLSSFQCLYLNAGSDGLSHLCAVAKRPRDGLLCGRQTVARLSPLLS